MNIDIDAIKYRLLKQIAATKILMIRYKKELFDLTQEADKSDEEQQYLIAITQEINYIVGVLKLNEMHLKNILVEVREDNEYANNHYDEITAVIMRISKFNRMIKLS